MKNRKEAKPLEELLKVAEIAKQTDEAVKAMKPETGTVSVLFDDHDGQYVPTDLDNNLAIQVPPEHLDPQIHLEWH